MNTIVTDGTLTEEEALDALRAAATAATEALPAALAKCKTDAQRLEVIGDRDKVLLAFLTALQKSLTRTGPLFEKVATDLQQAAEDVGRKKESLANANAAINLFSDLVRLSASLALAFV